LVSNAGEADMTTEYNFYTNNIERVPIDAYAVGKIIYPQGFSRYQSEEEGQRDLPLLCGGIGK
jgi:hypothetical protein